MQYSKSGGSQLKKSSYTLQDVRKIPPILRKFQAKKIKIKSKMNEKLKIVRTIP